MKRKYENFEPGIPFIERGIHSSTQIIVVIPAYNERDINFCLQSLLHADKLKEGSVEIIIVINEPEDAPLEIKEFHDKQYQFFLNEYSPQHDEFRVYAIHAKNLIKKFAGVGLARKIGMDEAAWRFQSIGFSDGIIACLDADTTVDKNYFVELQKCYQADKKLQAASVFFEHDIHAFISEEDKLAILQYELHLRYHINMQRLIGLPYSFHTIGSTMTVRQSAYLDHFGMNKRKAGEDFYFLHKFIKTGNYKEINSSTVYPSARFSDRVPFGTGRMVGKLSQGQNELLTYHPRSYEMIRDLVHKLKRIYEDSNLIDEILAPELLLFFGDRLKLQVDEIRNHTSDLGSFRKRFYRWFDAFQLIKCLHFLRDNYFGNIPIKEAVLSLFDKLAIEAKEFHWENLMQLREYDRTNPFVIEY